MRVIVSTLSDVLTARRAAEAVARLARFCPQDRAVVALVASELATNLARYAPGGALLAEQQGDPGCLRLVSTDSGPGIADLGAALKDGYSTGGGLGLGLGTIHRLMDRVVIQSTSLGTTIEAYKCCPHATPWQPDSSLAS